MADMDYAQQQWQKIVTHPQYPRLPDAEKEKAKEIFRQNVPGGNEFLVKTQEGPLRGALENIGRLTAESFRDAADSARMAGDVTTGSIDTNTAGIIARGHQRDQDNYNPVALEKMNSMLGRVSKEWSVAESGWDKMKAFGYTIKEAAKEIVTNPEGALQLGASSAGFSAAPMVGALTGSAVAGPVGGAIGAFTGGMTAEQGARFTQEIINKTNELGLDPSKESDVQKVLDNRDYVSFARDKAIKKAIGTALVDTALSGVSGRVGTALERAAVRQAKVANPGATGSALEEAIAQSLSNISSKAKLKQKLKAFGSEILSEPTSEAAGQLNAGDELDAGEILGEAIGAIGMAAPGQAVDTAVFGTKVAPSIVEAAKAKVSKTEDRKAAEKLSQTSADIPKYKEKIAEIVDTDTIKEYTNPDSDKYNPVIAVDALNEMNRRETTTDDQRLSNYRKAASAYQKLENRQIDRGERIQALYEKRKAGDLTAAEKKQLRDDEAAYKIEAKTLKDLDASIQSMTKGNLTADALYEKLGKQYQEGTSAEDFIAEIFSSGGASTAHSEVLGSHLEAMSKAPDASEPVKQFAKTALAELSTRKRLMDTISKSTHQVRNDVLHGGKGALGIDDYHMLIGRAVKNGQKDKAQADLAKLVQFADRHRQKADVLERATIAAREGKTLSAQDQAAIQSLESTRARLGAKNKGKYTIDPDPNSGWSSMLSLVKMEADLLEKAVATDTKLVELKLGVKPAKKEEKPTPRLKRRSRKSLKLKKLRKLL